MLIIAIGNTSLSLPIRPLSAVKITALAQTPLVLVFQKLFLSDTASAANH